MDLVVDGFSGGGGASTGIRMARGARSQRDHRARRRRHAPLQKTHGVRALAEGDYHGLPATVLVELDPRGLAPLWRWRVRVGDRAADSGAVTADEATAVREAFAALAALREGEKRETPPA